MPALYLALGVMTAIKEANQGFARKIEPCVLCSYDVACDDVADLRTPEGRAEHRVSLEEVACPWFSLLAQGKEPPSWDIARRLYEEGNAGILVPSFALVRQLRTTTSFCGDGAIGLHIGSRSSIQPVAFQRTSSPGDELVLWTNACATVRWKEKLGAAL